MYPPRQPNNPLHCQNDAENPSFSVSCPVTGMDCAQLHRNTSTGMLPSFPVQRDASTYYIRDDVLGSSVRGMNNCSMEQNYPLIYLPPFMHSYHPQQFGLQKRLRTLPTYGAPPFHSEPFIANSAQNLASSFKEFRHWDVCPPGFLNPTPTSNDSHLSHQASRTNLSAIAPRRPSPTSSDLGVSHPAFPADHVRYDTSIHSARVFSSGIQSGNYEEFPEAGPSAPKVIPLLADQRHQTADTASTFPQRASSRSVLATEFRISNTHGPTPFSVGGISKPPDFPGCIYVYMHPTSPPQNTHVDPNSQNDLPTVHSCGWADVSVSCNAALSGNLRDLRRHLQKDHRVNTTRKCHTTCRWLGCSKILQRESLLRHIVTCHLQIKVRCPDCGRKLARSDVWIKHALICPKRKGVTSSIPGAKDV
ncbi:hypothetical protein BS17DRAFT_449528 [Gyrodon lividus]|nr:hypothetical protein BS17DRAFT_449528 [Gyrodon lividus]